jgi:hypothetical protein
MPTMTQERETTAERPADTPPERTDEQRMEALLKANSVRLARAKLKQDLKAKRVDIVALLADPPEWLLTARIYELLLAIPKLGRTKVGRLTILTRISPSTTMGGLTRRQRAELAGAIRKWRRGELAL